MLQRKNHYVPKLYLKRWSNQEKKIWTYRLLVPNEKFPLWEQKAISGIPIYNNLYIKNTNSVESDEIEKWLASDFESPAVQAISKAVGNQRLSPSDWEKLIDFVAAQDVRTPARFIELKQHLDHYFDNFEKLPNDIRHNLIEESKDYLQDQDLIPIRINKIDTESDASEVFVHYEALNGRSVWLFAIKRLLSRSKLALHQQKWTILKSPQNFSFMTSDNPVIRLNYYGKNQECEYDFKGGWGSKGTEIFLPLSPQCLMYTQIGCRPPQRGTIIPIDKARYFQKFIVQHAHKFVFSSEVNPVVELIRPRIVDHNLYEEKEQKWKNWYGEETFAESQFLALQKEIVDDI